ncbi:MAG: hypothetical protein Q8S22_00855 [Eubacteriales bacterium]|nr:hypothetical protein [Eubacteriales bacterium]
MRRPRDSNRGGGTSTFETRSQRSYPARADYLRLARDIDLLAGGEAHIFFRKDTLAHSDAAVVMSSIRLRLSSVVANSPPPISVPSGIVVQRRFSANIPIMSNRRVLSYCIRVSLERRRIIAASSI